MRTQRLCIGIALLALGGSVVSAAPQARAARPATKSHRAVKARPAAKRAVTARRPTRATVARAVKKSGVLMASRKGAVARISPGRTQARWRVASARQETERQPGVAPAQTTAPAEASISQQAEPLMTRALAAYFVLGDDRIRMLRSRGWSYGDIATAGNVAARSQRSLFEVARTYEERRDWSTVAREMNVAPDEIYVATNSPAYVMIRPTPEEEMRMIAALQPTPAPSTAVVVTPATPDQPVAPDAVAPPAAPNAAAPPAAATPPTAVTPATPQNPAAVPPTDAVTPTPDVVPAQPAPAQRTMLTPEERVAGSRLELTPRNQSALLRRAVATYYALPSSTVRDLEARGWTLSDVLVAGNMAHRSEASLEEVVALKDAGQDWNTIAGRIGLASGDIYQPTGIRRVTAQTYEHPYTIRTYEERRTDER